MLECIDGDGPACVHTFIYYFCWYKFIDEIEALKLLSESLEKTLETTYNQQDSNLQNFLGD